MANAPQQKRFSFTKRAIEALPLSDERTDYLDDKVPHLTIRVAKRRVFYWYGRVDGRPKRIKLGPFPDLSVENARKAAQRISGNVAQGRPPLDEAPPVGKTLGELFDLYLETHAKVRKRSWEQDQYTYNRHLKGWGKRQLADITKAELQKLHAQIGTTI